MATRAAGGAGHLALGVADDHVAALLDGQLEGRGAEAAALGGPEGVGRGRRLHMCEVRAVRVRHTRVGAFVRMFTCVRVRRGCACACSREGERGAKGAGER